MILGSGILDPNAWILDYGIMKLGFASIRFWDLGLWILDYGIMNFGFVNKGFGI